jgi:cystathionine beta-lyase/cystathionine gamma-synthase
MAPDKSIFTKAVHAGERGPLPDFRPVSTPIYQTVGYLYDDMHDLDRVFANERDGYVYARYGSPTNAALELALADLEAGEAALSFGSGMAAVHAGLLAAGVKSGASLVAAYDIYGATYAICARLFADLGVRVQFVDVADLSELERALADLRPAAIMLETISNPLMKVADVPAIARLARQTGTKVIVDNTFATPVLFHPLAYGVDFCVHSTTKYISGHGDVLGGMIVTSAKNRSVLHEIIKMTGGNLGPTEAWLTHRGLKTLPLRMLQHCRNASTVAEWLSKHPRISRVYYPGLADHPQHKLAKQLFPPGLFGSMISFELKAAGKAEVFRFLEALKLVLPATTLENVYSLTLYPAISSHRALTPEERAQFGISDSLIRLSVGIEDASDIIDDLAHALAQSG